MKKPALLFLLSVICFFIVSCGKDNASNDKVNFVSTTDQSLTVFLSKTQIMSDGTEQAVITVKDDKNVDVTTSSVIYVNDIALTKNVFITITPGSYQVRATKGSLASAVVNLIATNGLTSVFTQKVLAEFFTGTWCGICPGTLIPLENYTNANPNTIMIGVHGPSGSNDPFTFIYDTQMRNAFGVGGVPTVLVNRNGFWDGNNTSLDQLTRNSAPLGIGIETTVSGSTIAIKTKVKFGLNINAPLKLVVMLVEDGIPYDQTNYGHFSLPNPIVSFAHRNVLRSTATDIFGDAIPQAQQIKDNVWQRDLTIDASKYTLSRCRMVAFVTYDTNGQGLKGVLNSQIINAGQNITF